MYTENSDLDDLLKSVINVVAARTRLDRIHIADVKQALKNYNPGKQ